MADEQGIVVVLDWMEVIVAAVVGVLREVRHRQAGHEHKWNGATTDGWTRDIEGACAEKAAAKLLGVFWYDGRESKTDAGRFQVRHTMVEGGRLILHPEDNDADEFVLVRGVAPRFQVVGWCLGREGKRQEYWSDPLGNRPAFFVPNSILHSTDDLYHEPA